MTTDHRLPYLAALERKVLWLASWAIHNANHLRENADGLKVGGHQASSASLAAIMTALYFAVLKPEDRVAVKPHASPVFHAIQYLLGKQTREKLENFRGFGGAQSYPSRTKDSDDVDFSTGSVGLGVAITSFASMVQDYVHAHGWAGGRPKGRMIALVGDAELDEGNIYEALLEGWKFGLRNTWWIIDYNRQSLDAVVREDLHTRFEKLFPAMGWDLVVLKYGKLQQAAFAEPGGERLEAMDRFRAEPALLGADFPGRRGVAQAPDGRSRRSRRCHKADRTAQRRGALGLDEQSGRPRYSKHSRSVRIHRSRPAGLFPLLHRERLRTAARGPQGQSRRPDERSADGGPARDA